MDLLRKCPLDECLQFRVILSDKRSWTNKPDTTLHIYMYFSHTKQMTWEPLVMHNWHHTEQSRAIVNLLFMCTCIHLTDIWKYNQPSQTFTLANDFKICSICLHCTCLKKWQRAFFSSILSNWWLKHCNFSLLVLQTVGLLTAFHSSLLV